MPYLVLELVEGGTLADQLAAGRSIRDGGAGARGGGGGGGTGPGCCTAI
ncbi:MAG: hypothetical protein U0736_25350 [Gemmataceae bacterium]